MRVLLDTNIIIHREASRVVNQDIGILFKWLDKLSHTKCVHPLTVEELGRHYDASTVKTMQIKLTNYQVMQTTAPLHIQVKQVSMAVDTTPNDINDTKLINEVFCDRVDILISEDKKIHKKAEMLGLTDRVFRIDSFLEKVTAENPDFVNYNVLAVKRDYFGNIDLADEFFDSFRDDYISFDKWYNGKAGNNDKAYVCYEGDLLKAFLFLKVEDENEAYPDINPTFSRKKRLKIGTFKVVSNGLRIGERFLKIVFDNARMYKVDEIYVTVFDKRPEVLNLTSLLERYGFKYFGEKVTPSGTEVVLVRNFSIVANDDNPKLTFPWLSKSSDVYIIPIKPEYHTKLFPDSILRTESADDFVESEPYANAISKTYVSHSRTRGLQSGDVIVFYRTGGIYRGVVTTIGIVESTVIPNELSELVQVCRKRTVLTEEELREYWDRYPSVKPFAINFLYAFSFVRRMNLKLMLDTNILPTMDAIKTITKIERESLVQLIKKCGI